MKVKEFKWTPIEQKPKNDKGQESACLLWIWDEGVSMGLVVDGLFFWTDGQWVNYMGEPMRECDGQIVTSWCYVTPAKRRKSPK